MPVFKDPNQRVHMILQQLGYEPTPMYGSNKDEKEDGSYTMTAETTTTPITTAALTGITGTVEDENIVDPTLSLEPYFDDDDDDDDDDCDNLFFGSSTFHSCNDEGSGVDRNGLTLTASTVDLNRRSGVTPGPDPHNDTQSSTNLFISNFPHNYGENELEAMFAPYGEILSAAVMRNIHTGKSRGTAFVRYATTEQAKRAIAEVNGQNVRGRTISVHWAKKQHDDTPVGEARKKIFKLFVRNIPLDVTLEQLKELFRQYGPVKEISIHKDTAAVADRRLERRIAFVAYLAEGAAERAAECVHNTRPFPSSGSIPLMVKLAEDLPARSRRRASLEVPTATTATTARKMTFGDVHASVRPCVQTHPTGISLCGLPPQPASCPTYADPNAASWSYTPPHHMNAARPLPYENIANPRPCRYYPPFPPMLSNVRAERLARSSLGPMAHQMSAWREFSQLPETVTIYNRSSSAYGMEVGGAPFSLAAHPSRGGIYSSNCSSMYAQEFEETSEKRMLHPPISHDSGLRQQQQYQYQQQQQQQEGLTGPNISKCGPQGSFSSSPDTIISEDVSTAGVTNTTPDSASHIRRYTHNPYKALRDENLEDPVTPLSVV